MATRSRSGPVSPAASLVPQAALRGGRDGTRAGTGWTGTCGRDVVTKAGRAGMNGEHIELAIHDRIANVRDTWLAMEERCPVSVYQRYEWVETYLDNSDHAAAVQPLIVEGRLDGQTVFILPLALHGRHLPRVKFIGGSHINFNLGIFLPEIIPLMTPQVMRQVFGRIGKLMPGGAYLAMCCQPESWEGMANPLTGLSHQKSANTAFALNLEGGFDAALERGNAKRKRKKFRQQCRMAEELGGYELFKPQTCAEVEEVISVFFEQKSRRLRELGIRDIFSDDKVRGFVTDLALRSPGMERPLLQLYALRIGGDIVAIFGGGGNRTRFSGYFSSFDTNGPAALSPGEMLLYLVVEDVCRQGYREIDLGAGEERYKRSWSSEEVTMYDVFVAQTPAGVPIVMLRRIYGNIRRIARQTPLIWSGYKRLRRWRGRLWPAGSQ